MVEQQTYEEIRSVSTREYVHLLDELEEYQSGIALLGETVGYGLFDDKHKTCMTHSGPTVRFVFVTKLQLNDSLGEGG